MATVVITRPPMARRSSSFQSTSGTSLRTVSEETHAELVADRKATAKQRGQDVYNDRAGIQVTLSDLSLSSSTPTASCKSGCNCTYAPSRPEQALHDVAYTLRELWTLDRFERLVATREGRARIRAFLTNRKMPTAALDLYQDMTKLARVQAYARLLAVGIRDSFTAPTSLNRKAIADDTAALVSKNVEPACEESGVNEVSKRLLDQLYANEFQSYLKHRLIATVTAQLARLDIRAEKAKGLGEAFVLSNPRLPDCPIVLASAAFSELTGYAVQRIVGRNCRFLQGSATAPQSIRTIRDAISKGEQCTQLMLNYTLSGRPFWNLLCILPLHDSAGNLIYFLGGQTDVSLFLDDMFESFEDIIASEARSTSPLDEIFDNESPSIGSPKSPTQTGAGGLDTPPPTPFESTTSTTKNGRPSMKPAGSSSFFGKQRRSKVKEAEPLHDTSRKPLYEAILSLSNVYERVIIVKADTYNITYVTPGFLDLIGQRGATQLDAARSPLLSSSFFDLVYGKSDHEARSSARAVREAMESGTCSSFALSLKSLDIFGTLQSGGAGGHYGGSSNSSSSGASAGTVKVNVHLTTMQDMYRDAAAYVVVVTPSSSS